MPYELLEDTKSQPQSNNDLLRTGLRTAARGIESIVGLPGDIANIALSLGNLGIEKLTGKESPLPNNLPIPGSQDIRKLTKGLSGEYLEPQSEKESFWDDIVSDFATLAIPIKGKIPFKNAAIKALGGNLASWGAKELGAGELGQAGAKLGFVTIANLAGGKNSLQKKMTENYKQAETLAKGKTINAKNLGTEVDQIFQKINKGDKPYTNFLNERLTKINSAIHKDKIEVLDAWELKKDMNQYLYDPKTPKGAKPYLKKITSDLNKSIAEFGKKSPEFGNIYHEAEDIYKGLNQSSKINDWLQKHTNLENIMKNPISKGLLFGGATYYAGAPAALAGVAGSKALASGVKSFEFLKNSKEAQKYYANALKAAAENNIAIFSKNAKALDKIADKTETKGRYELLD